MKIAALIITKNEEITIAACITSCTFGDRVIVLDSHSDDATRDIALKLGAEVHTRPFDDYAQQRNAALEIAADYDWALMIDADERCTPDLAAEIAATVRFSPNDIALYRVRRKDMFFGSWLRRDSGYPTWFSRLVRPRRARVVRAINEECVVDGGEGRLQGHLLHEPFVKGISHWIDRHNRHSTLEARQLTDELRRGLARLDTLNSAYASGRRFLKQTFIACHAGPQSPFSICIPCAAAFWMALAGIATANCVRCLNT